MCIAYQLTAQRGYREDSTLEEDFFIQSVESLIPVEVKAKSGKTKSLRTLIDSDKYSDIQYGFKFSYNNIGYSDRIFTFPYFCDRFAFLGHLPTPTITT